MGTYSSNAVTTITVNGGQSMRVLKGLEDQAAKIKKALQQAEQAGDFKKVKKLTKELRDTEKVIAQLSSESASLEKILQRLDRASPKELNKAMATLKRQLNGMERGSEAWNAQINKIKQVKAEIDKMNMSMKATLSGWQQWSKFFYDNIAAFTAYAGALTGVVATARSAVKAYAEMDEQLANTTKYTGMSREEVEKLNRAFKEMDTRTSREKLNELAQEAGRLGKNTLESVKGYVEAADIINVALVDLGEGATQTIAKLTNIFGVEQMLGTKDAMLAVGSTVNVLSQNCTASKPYLVEFAQRMAGIGSQAGLTIPQILAFGAVLDANGQKVEMSSTAIQKVIMNLANKNKAFAKTVGLDADVLNKTLKSSARDGLMMFLEALHKIGESSGYQNATMSLAPALKDMGLDAARVSQVLSTLAKHIDELKWQFGEADKAFAEATSATNEYVIFNNTAQSSIDKAKKRMTELRVELGEKLYPMMKHVYSSSSLMLRVISAIVDFLIRNRTEIVVLAGAMAMYTMALKTNTIVTKASAASSAALAKVHTLLKAGLVQLKAGFTIVTLALGRFTNTINMNIAAQRRWIEATNAIKATSWVGLLLAVASAMFIMAKRYSDNIRLQRKLNEERRKFREEAMEIESKAIDSYSREISSLKRLYEAATNESLSKKERIRNAQELINLYPDQFKGMTAEQVMLGKAKSAYDDLTESIINNARAKAAAEKVLENEKKILELQEDLRKSRAKYVKADEEKKTIEARNRDADNRASKSAETLAGSIAMSEGGSAALYEHQTTAEQDERLKTAAGEMRKSKGEIRVLENANASLTNRYGKNKAFKDSFKSENSTVSEFSYETPEITIGDGVVVDKEAEKERKKREAEAKRAAIKERKEFKDGLKDIKGARDKADAEALASRIAGDIDFLQYQEAKRKAEEDFYRDSEAFYRKWGMEEDADFQTLLKKKEESEQKYNERRLVMSREVTQRQQTIDERDARQRYEQKKNKTLADELQLQEELLTIRYNSLMDQQSLYDQGSQEWESLQRQIDDLFFSDQEEKRKKIVQSVAEFEKKYRQLSVEEKYRLESDALKYLYEQKYISETQYQEWLKRLEREKTQERKKELQELPGYRKDSNSSKAEDARTKYDEQKALLDDAKGKGIIDDKEYVQRLSRIRHELNSALVDPLRTAQSEWVQMLSTAYQSWSDFAEAIKDPEADPFAAMADGIAATAAIVSSVIQQITEFSKAELEIQTKAIEKRYDREIAFAEGNSYLTKKLEKEKQQEIDKLKAEQAKKDFALQVVATVAQTAANAVQAYSAGLSIGGPAGLIMAPIAAAMAVAQGMMQVAILKKQQQAAEAIGYSEGGFTAPGEKDQPAGIVHAGEWVASQKLVRNPAVRPIIDMLEYAQRNNRIGSISMEDVSRSIAAPMVIASAMSAKSVAATSDAGYDRPAQSDSGQSNLQETLARLNERLEKPFITVNSVTGETGSLQAQRRYERMINNKSGKK